MKMKIIFINLNFLLVFVLIKANNANGQSAISKDVEKSVS